MYIHHNTDTRLSRNINQILLRTNIIKKVKEQFSRFGYREIHTPAFQPYDLYVHMNGTVNQQEMIKTIDNTGNVLVLRPDITIPLTKQIANDFKSFQKDLRFFYISDVFRQSNHTKSSQENTQIGIEYFGNNSPEADAEVIAVAIQLLQKVNHQMKVEIGHAGFFKELIKELDLPKEQLKELKGYIQAKNVPEIEHFLKTASIQKDLSELVTSLPFLYGKPEEVMKKLDTIHLTETMRETLNNLMDICHNIFAYGFQEQIAIDLSLINHMDYYSDIIFQGFIENAGKPILMGGRYNTLAEQFHAHIPAVGFACDLDLLLEHTKIDTITNTIDTCIIYNKETMRDAITAAQGLRNNGMQVVHYPAEANKDKIPETKTVIHVEETAYVVHANQQKVTFTSIDSLIDFFQKEVD